MNGGDAGYGNDLADRSTFHFHSLQAVKHIHLADFYTFLLVRIVMVHQQNLLIQFQRTVVDFADTDSSHIFIVVDGADQHLNAQVRIAFRCRNILENGLKKRRHVLSLVFQLIGAPAVTAGSIQERRIQLIVTCAEIHQKLEHLIDDLLRTCIRTVYFIDHDNDLQVERQSLLQNKSRLRHGSLESIDQENDTVNHLQDTFYLTAEIRVAWRIDDVDFGVLIMNCRVLGKNGDASLPLDGTGVHDTFLNHLIITEGSALSQEFVDQCRLAVIDMSNDGNITDIISGHFHADYLTSEKPLSDVPQKRSAARFYRIFDYFSNLAIIAQ